MKLIDLLCLSISYLLWKLLQSSTFHDGRPNNRKIQMGLLPSLNEAPGGTAKLSPQKVFSSPVIWKELKYSN